MERQFLDLGLQRRAGDPRRGRDRHPGVRADPDHAGHRLHPDRHAGRPVRARRARRRASVAALCDDFATPQRDRAVRRARHRPAAVLDRARAVVPALVVDAADGVRRRRRRAGRLRGDHRRRPACHRARRIPGSIGARPRAGAVLDRDRAAAGRHRRARSAAPRSACCCSRIWRWSRSCSRSARWRPAPTAGVGPLLGTLLLGGAVALGMLFGGRLLLPILFAQAARTKNPEAVPGGLPAGRDRRQPGHLGDRLFGGPRRADRRHRHRRDRISRRGRGRSPRRSAGSALGIFLITVGMSVDLRPAARQLAELSWSRSSRCCAVKAAGHRRAAAAQRQPHRRRRRNRRADGLARRKPR